MNLVRAVLLPGVILLNLPVAFPSSAGQSQPAQFVDLGLLLPSANYDIRYFGTNNFIGEKIAGYNAPKCILHISAADALIKASESLQRHGLRLKIFDCYRPKKAVSHFVRWAKDLDDQSTKTSYYPNLDKSQLLGDYIAKTSGHSRGYTLDVTLEFKSMSGDYQELDMGTPYDWFDTRSNTDDNRINLEQKKNRYLLKGILAQYGFENYPMEWWHFTYKSDPKNKYWDFDIK